MLYVTRIANATGIASASVPLALHNMSHASAQTLVICWHVLPKLIDSNNMAGMYGTF